MLACFISSKHSLNTSDFSGQSYTHKFNQVQFSILGQPHKSRDFVVSWGNAGGQNDAELLFAVAESQTGSSVWKIMYKH